MGLSRKKLHPQQHKNLRSDPRAGVKEDVVNVSSAGGNKTLMPFVQARHQSSSQHCKGAPANGPSRSTSDWQRLTPGAEQQDAEQTVTEDVAAFAHEEVPMLELLPVKAEQEME